MIVKSTFRKHLYEKIMSAMKVCDFDNVIDMRLYVNNGNGNFLGSGIFSIFETDELYEQVKNLDADWFIDFYENIAKANTAEYTDVSLFRDACRKMSVEEFDAKWGVDVDRYALSEEVEKEFVEDAFNMYETGGFFPTFHTQFTDRADMNGVAFQVIGRATTEDCDLEQLPMWKIEFEDGTEHYAFPCEITEIENKNLNLAQNLQLNKSKPNVKEEDKQMYALVYLYEGVDDDCPFAQTIAVSDDKEKLKLELKKCVEEDTRYPDVDGDDDDEEGDEWDTDCNWIERQNYGGEDVRLQHRKRINLYAQYYIHSVKLL